MNDYTWKVTDGETVYQINKDEYSFTLYKEQEVVKLESKNFGKKTLRIVGHYPSLHSLLTKLIELKLMSKSDITNFNQELWNTILDMQSQFKVLAG